MNSTSLLKKSEGFCDTSLCEPSPSAVAWPERNLGRRLRPEQAKRLLQDGAKTYGFWQLPDDALDGLVSSSAQGLHR